MASLQLRDVVKRFDDTVVIHGATLDVQDGEFVVFVGPSGCGKSTLLRMICGLESVSSGDVMIAGRRVNDLPAAQRGLAMVFQSYALYPHMTVRQNLAFGLENLRTPRAEVDRRVGEAARMLRLEPLLERRPTQLSGGQRQRVAIGRAIVREPAIFLFDEPLSNLDAELRVAMRSEITALHRRLGTTMIYVTHDQVEAMTMADRIVVLRAGRIEQVGAPLELYNNPANRFVAGFIGSPQMNFLRGRIADDGRGVMLDAAPGSPLPLSHVGATPGTPVEVGIRPEHLTLGERDSPALTVPLSVDAVEQLGAVSTVQGHVGSASHIAVHVPGQRAFAVGDSVPVHIPLERVHVFAADDAGRRLSRPGA